MSEQAGARARILVVDDSRLMRKAALKMLGDEFDIVTGDDGLDAWAKVEADHAIQVVFTDLNMPRLDGYGLLEKIRSAEDSGIQGLPVIVVTGAEDDEKARMKALDRGATDFISKPFTASDLIARARAHATYTRVTRRLQEAITLDPTTGLANRAGFVDRLQQDIAYARRHQQPLSLMQVEIEDFRRFFLQHGREAADALLQHVGRLLRGRIRKEDTAGRIGLGAFGLSLPGGQEAGIIALVDWLRERLASAPPVIAGEPRQVRLLTAVMSPLLDPNMGAVEALEAIQRRLEPLPEAGPVEEGASPPASAITADAPGASGSAEVAAPTAGPTTVPAAAAPAAQPAPAARSASSAPASAPAAAASAEISVDEVLERIRQGRAREVLPQVPAVIGKLLPLLRLLGPRQRAQLIQFLQK
ncbi:GGDEF domain-containing response regulator [Arenimonas fontis]|uniref:Response regulator n=1 Tax=Arenimonas fontis TaxID=2608255 RepID=A0A5B2Z6S6_9GAMM|nr:response regulator [Arenimonas fontis]KAA2284478.1 response regulator [Arenimonas fontis]